MHISEGFLPLTHAAAWTCVAAPFVIRSISALGSARENRYLLTAHGGLTTLGANVFSLGVAGPWTTWLLWRFTVRCGLGDRSAIMAATAIGSLATYACTSLQLALAHPDPTAAGREPF